MVKIKIKKVKTETIAFLMEAILKYHSLKNTYKYDMLFLNEEIVENIAQLEVLAEKENLIKLWLKMRKILEFQQKKYINLSLTITEGYLLFKILMLTPFPDYLRASLMQIVMHLHLQSQQNERVLDENFKILPYQY